MNPIVFALRRPVTVVVAMIALAGGGALAWSRMKVDVFPSLNLPVIYVAQPYGGLDPAQMEGLITNYYEYHFLYIGGIHHVESKNVQGVALMKLYFHPGTDMAQAMAETVGYVNRSRAFMPPGTVQPFIMRFDTGSVPVGYLVLKSDSRTVAEIQDLALFKVRPMFAGIPGVSAPPPFGGNQRTIVVRIDPDRLRSYRLSPDDVVKALSEGNTISPSGAVRIQEQMPLTPLNAMVVDPKDLGKIPVRLDRPVFLRDVVRRDPNTDRPLIDDASDVPSGYALANGRRAVYILATKRADASTLSVVEAIKAKLPEMQKALPDDIRVSFEFDQSPYVTGAMQNVGVEAGLGAILTGLMVLLFLRDWRSVVVVVLNIPLALTGALIALALCGQTVNLMTLGGLALSVGILVDESTVEVENIHTQMDKSANMAEAVRRGNAETAVPRLLAMLCVLAVFIPSFFMQGAAQALFAPLALAVGFAMVTSYLLSSTLVPVLSVWLLRKRAGHREGVGRGAFHAAYASVQSVLIRLRWLVAPAYLVVAALALFLGWQTLGVEIFPKVDAGQFQLRLRAPTGTRIEQTEAITKEALEYIKQEVGEENVAITLGYVGAVPSTYPINNIYLWTSGPEEAVLRVSLKPGSRSVEELKRELREKLTDHLREWLAKKWRDEGVPEARIAQRVPQLHLSFEPADIINDVMSFGSPTPIEVVVNGVHIKDGQLAKEDVEYAEKVRGELERIPSLRDVQFMQTMDYPTVRVNVDREKAGASGVTVNDVAKSLVEATSSSRFTVPNYWADPKTGIGYQVQVEVPQGIMNSVKEVETVPVKRTDGGEFLLRDVAEVREGTMPGEFDRFNMRRLVSVTANIDGEDLGRVTARVARALKAAGDPPGDVKVDVRGQAPPLEELVRGLGLGLGLAVAVVFLLLTAYFQSFRLALAATASAPAAMAGVVLALLATGTTLNLQSFMGAIMAVGVATANAILLVTFAERRRREGLPAAEAAVEGAWGRVRPILMTTAAMVAGMLPMALGLGERGDQTAPLGRAVIGGLLAATATTLLVLPAVYALLMGGASRRSPSLDPADPESSYHVAAKPPAAEADPTAIQTEA
jgi:multidrug efflux pump subunit AcrB